MAYKIKTKKVKEKEQETYELPLEDEERYLPFDRIETTYNAIDEMARSHNKPRPVQFGGGKWNKNEELALYIKQVGRRYTPLQYKVMLTYAKKEKGFNISKAEKEVNKLFGR